MAEIGITSRSSALRHGEAPWPLLVAGLAAVHLFLVTRFVPRHVVLSNIPLLNDAFAIEAYRAVRFRFALDDGAAWVYDPQVLAGQPAGFVELFGSRFVPLAVAALSRAGVQPGRAFNVLVLVFHASVPLLAYATARAFELRGRATALLVAAWSGIWFFDGLVHYTWFSGRLSFLVASQVVVLAMGLLYRAAHGAGASVAAFAGTTAALALAFLLQPAVALLGVIAAAAVTTEVQVLPRRRILLLSSIAAPLLLLVPVAPHLSALSSEPAARVFRTGPGQLLWDLLEILGAGYGAPGPARTLFRCGAYVAGAIGLLRLRAGGDRRSLPILAVAVLSAGLAYLGGVLPIAWPVDPYFFAGLLAFATSVPAAIELDAIRWADMLQKSRGVRIALILAALVVVPRGFRTVATYFPSLLPERVLRSPMDRFVSAFVGLNEPGPDPLRHESPPAAFYDVASFLVEHTGSGRVAVDDGSLATLLAVSTPLSVLGPVSERRGSGRGADPSPYLQPDSSARSRAEYLSRYAVEWVVLTGPPGPFDREEPALAPPIIVGGARLRRVVAEPSFFAEGAGTIEKMAASAIRVSDAAGARVTLRFHYGPTLACRPGCRVESRAIPGDPTGFVSVPDPPREFEVYSR